MANLHTQATVPFLHSERGQRTHTANVSDVSSMSVVSIRATSLDVCEYVYGEGVTSMDVVSRFYEPNASKFLLFFLVNRCSNCLCLV